MTAVWIGYACAAGLALLASAFFSGAETGIYCLNRVRLQLGSDRNDRSARRLARFLVDEPAALSVTLIGTNVANYALTGFVAMFISHQLGLGDRDSELYTTLALTPIVFTFGEVVPKNIFRVAADRLMYPAVLALEPLRTILLPVINALRRIRALISELLGKPGNLPEATAITRGRAVAMLHDGLIDAGHEEEQFDFINRVLALSHTPVYSVMVPRNRVVTIRADAGRSGLVTLARKNRHTRIPVYEQNARRIVGAVVVHEFLADADATDLRQRLEAVLSLSPRDSVASTILQMQKSRQTMGVVVDRNGLLLGLVTLKDLMEEIVGELAEW
jgi:CBS domain containing-hemolysin-like protein